MKKLNKGLCVEEISALDKAFIELFKLQNTLRAELPIARHIKFPPVPSILSESMVIMGARRLFNLGDSWNAFRGGKICDVLLIDNLGNQQRVEVKATGERETLELKPRDIEKEWLVWVAFGSRYGRGHGEIVFYVLRYPYNYLDPKDSKNRVTKLSKFLSHIGETKDLSIYKFITLEEFFSAVLLTAS